jgi:protein-S-isoprenylcysteine O-methyltransferase Ste14
MNTRAAIPPCEQHPNVTAGIVKRFGQIAIGFAVEAAILFLAAGRLTWVWAWVFLGISLVSVLINGTFLLRTSPETVAERGEYKGMQDWDKLVSGLWSLAQYLLLPLAAGLDVRFGWTPQLGAAWHGAGAAIFAAGMGLSGWAMIVNAYFSTVVRIQRDRGHTVCRSGPYRFVRHPGYVGFMLQSLGIPLLLGSWWALIPGLAAIGTMIVRTAFEDRMLQAELPGYQDYVQQVRYRLLPGVW